MSVRVIHTTNTKTGADLWIVFDGQHMITRGKKRAALDAWQREHGKINAYNRIEGIIRPSEAAMEIAEVQRSEEK